MRGIQATVTKLTAPVTAKDHTQGPAAAPITLVEYGDYQCPSCGDVQPIIKKLQKHFGDKLRFVFRNFPLPMHEHAEHAAEAAEFAASHDKFWEMHDLLFKHQANLADTELLKLATELKLPAAELTKALAAHTFAPHIKGDLKSGEASGLQGTPTFYINGKRHDESYDYDSLVEALKAAH